MKSKGKYELDQNCQFRAKLNQNQPYQNNKRRYFNLNSNPSSQKEDHSSRIDLTVKLSVTNSIDINNSEQNIIEESETRTFSVSDSSLSSDGLLKTIRRCEKKIEKKSLDIPREDEKRYDSYGEEVEVIFLDEKEKRKRGRVKLYKRKIISLDKEGRRKNSKFCLLCLSQNHLLKDCSMSQVKKDCGRQQFPGQSQCNICYMYGHSSENCLVDLESSLSKVSKEFLIQIQPLVEISCPKDKQLYSVHQQVCPKCGVEKCYCTIKLLDFKF